MDSGDPNGLTLFFWTEGGAPPAERTVKQLMIRDPAITARSRDGDKRKPPWPADGVASEDKESKRFL